MVEPRTRLRTRRYGVNCSPQGVKRIAGIYREMKPRISLDSIRATCSSHLDSVYFNTDKIEKDQVESLAQRKGVSVQEVERWLSPVLAYEPGATE